MYCRATLTTVKIAVMLKLVDADMGIPYIRATTIHVTSETRNPIAVLVSASAKLSMRDWVWMRGGEGKQGRRYPE